MSNIEFENVKRMVENGEKISAWQFKCLKDDLKFGEKMIKQSVANGDVGLAMALRETALEYKGIIEKAIVA